MSLVALVLLSATATALDAPITAVTVFSGQARVTRTAKVAVGGTERFELPLLPQTVRLESIRVEATGAEVTRVDIAQVGEGAFPADEARALLAQIEALDDKLARARGEHGAVSAVLGAVTRIAPAPPAPPSEPLRPVPKLTAGGWDATIGFTRTWMEKLQAQQRKIDEQVFGLERERRVLVEKARLLGASERRTGYRVAPTLAGKGTAHVTVTYMVDRARWKPVYDLQLLLADRRVQVAFAGLVDQQSGEDWVDAQVTVSTAVPAQATELPKLLSWKIGEKERFIPTPIPVAETVRPPPPSVPPVALDRGEDRLREALAALAGDSDGRADKDDQNEEATGRRYESLKKGKRAPSRASDELDSMLESAPRPPPPPPRSLTRAPQRPMEAPAAAAAPMMAEQSEAADAARGAAAAVAIGDMKQREAMMGVGLSPPPGYQRPYFPPDDPVSLAGGYDLAFPSLRPETVRSGGNARRVALLADRWPVEVERRLYPALAPEAFLTAQLKSPAKQPLPGGQANLAVGNDPAGVATLQLVSPGEPFVLPLGLDRAVRPVRNVKLVTTEKGVFSKDEINEYQVSIEVANPYRAPIAVRVFDQVPITSDKNVEIKLLSSTPKAVVDEPKGQLEWLVTIPAGGKTALGFTYTLRRPKGWRLHQ